MSSQRFIGDGIEFATLNVCLELAIPGRPVKRKKPVAQLRKFLGGQSPDLGFNSFDFAHDTSLALSPNRRLTSGLYPARSRTEKRHDAGARRMTTALNEPPFYPMGIVSRVCVSWGRQEVAGATMGELAEGMAAPGKRQEEQTRERVVFEAHEYCGIEECGQAWGSSSWQEEAQEESKLQVGRSWRTTTPNWATKTSRPFLQMGQGSTVRGKGSSPDDCAG